MTIAPRYRLPVAIAASAAVVLVVLVAVLVSGGGNPTPTATPAPSPTSSAQPTSTPGATDPLASPEGAVRAFFAALKEARRTDDAGTVRPYVTDEQSSAYLSIEGFVAGQKAGNKASVLTVQQLDNIRVQTTGATATVQLTYTEGGYDISLDSGKPLESPGTLAPRAVTMELRQVDGHWLVDTYEAQAQ